MIHLGPIEDISIVKDLFCKNNIDFTANSGCVSALCNNKNIGYCLYELNSKSMTINYIYPCNDIMLADGILRSTLHVAAERGINDAYYSKTAPEELFAKLEFIKDKNKMSLKIEKLFESCCCKH